MGEKAIFLNSGPLFSAERLESLDQIPEWSEYDAAAREAYDHIREIYEKHATLLAGRPSVNETRYFMINPSLHALGYTHTVQESVQVGNDRTARIDNVCFASSADFYEAEPSRGSQGFFRPALCIVRAVEWGSDFSGAVQTPAPAVEGAEAAPVEPPTPGIPPASELDILLRTTGKDYGILTNGCDWRLYHRGTSSLQDTFFQADMIAALKSDFEDFKRFYLLFRKGALTRSDAGTSFLDSVLQ